MVMNMKIERRKKLNANVGVISVGLDTYWSQFPGLLEEMNRKTSVFVEKLKRNSVTVFDFGMVDNAGVAAKMFGALYDADINIHMISTSEIKVSVLLDESVAALAVQAIHDKFFGE